jgi:Fe2+ transport system protein FeoA
MSLADGLRGGDTLRMKPDDATPVFGVDAAVEGTARDDCPVCPLSALGCGRGGRVVRLAGAPRIVRRLLALGVRPSIECHVLGRAPNGGPIHLRAGSVHLMVRADEADDVLVRPEPGEVDVLPSL